MSLKEYIFVKPVIKTERLTLRRLTVADVPALKEWTADKSLYEYWGKSAGKADKDPSLMFAAPEKPTKSFHWGIIEAGAAIGELWVYLIENDRMAKVAFRVSPARKGRGIATEALSAAVDFIFANTEIRRLWSDVDVRNTGSCRVLEKCGFSREGLIRQGKLVSTWCDYYIYGLLNTDRR